MKRNDNTPSGFVAITASDTAQVNLCGFVVGVAGNVAVIDSLGVTTVVPAVAGVPIYGSIVTVKSTSTTATGIVGLVP